ncbi:MAG: hypothetical protein K0R77_1333 [Chryseobacterium sp.]|jgi:hypothetical protein|uniref:DUF6705 family protein n=1 Tax=Chryseobacterium sp. TaxID=1871047 RepID=UPI00260E8A60|nr:DUF6705 family protein [Chryseobacterium sp.]MDF2552058.1 hypothetical protein [Chryseobacterium sp.]
MKNIILVATLFLSVLSCKAQVIGTLEQFEECSNRPNHDEGCPDLENITYVKDTNNRLNQFVGIWKGTYGGKQYEIKLEKKINSKYFITSKISWDRIIGRMIIKNDLGIIIYNSTNEPDNNISFFGNNFQHRAYEMHFVGNWDCAESGQVFIETRLNNSNEMTLFYARDLDVKLDPAKCPNYSSFVQLLPNNKMTLVKQ